MFHGKHINIERTSNCLNDIMTKIISFANQKGGVGKTTTAVNLSAALAEAGQSVLAIDFDPQGNLSSGLGIDKTNTEKTIYEVIIGDEDINDTILNTEVENLDIIPSNVDLSGAEIELLELEDRERTLRRKIGEIYKQYDYILIDCPPSLSLLTINAFMASDSVIIPIQCEYYALEGLNQMLRTVNLIRERLNPTLEIEGIVFTMYDARNNLSGQVIEGVKSVISDENIFETIIPRNVKLAEAPSFGMPITEYDTTSTGAQAYRMLASEVLSKSGR